MVFDHIIILTMLLVCRATSNSLIVRGAWGSVGGSDALSWSRDLVSGTSYHVENG